MKLFKKSLILFACMCIYTSTADSFNDNSGFGQGTPVFEVPMDY